MSSGLAISSGRSFGTGSAPSGPRCGISQGFLKTQGARPAVTAHNGYLDEALATGAIGLLLIVAAWLAAMWNAFRIVRAYTAPNRS